MASITTERLSTLSWFIVCGWGSLTRAFLRFSGAGRRQICSPRREPWVIFGQSKKPRTGVRFFRSGACCRFRKMPTTHVVGYNSAAAPRLRAGTAQRGNGSLAGDATVNSCPPPGVAGVTKYFRASRRHDMPLQPSTGPTLISLNAMANVANVKIRVIL